VNRAGAYANVLEKIDRACEKSGRGAEAVQLVTVSKTFPPDIIKEVYEAGARCFGESRAQEFRDKTPLLAKDISWHFIGHLQKNKIKYVAQKADLIHSVDSMDLAEALSGFATQKNIQISVLIEINTSAEDTKHGFSTAQAEEMYLRINKLPGICTKGLMTIAPYTEDEHKVRRSFCHLRELGERIARHLSEKDLQILSMGMSHDFEWAIEEGSTMVRVGSAIFGPRGR